MRFVSGKTVSADLVVFADGITSPAREYFEPAATLTYSGYVGWRGTVALSDLTGRTRDALDDAIGELSSLPEVVPAVVVGLGPTGVVGAEEEL